MVKFNRLTDTGLANVRNNNLISTRYIKNLNLRKKVGIAIKSKETSNQLEPVRNGHV